MAGQVHGIHQNAPTYGLTEAAAYGTSVGRSMGERPSRAVTFKEPSLKVEQHHYDNSFLSRQIFSGNLITKIPRSHVHFEMPQFPKESI